MISPTFFSKKKFIHRLLILVVDKKDNLKPSQNQKKAAPALLVIKSSNFIKISKLW